MSREELEIVGRLRRVLLALGHQESVELLTGKLRETSSNAEFLRQILRETAA